MISTYAELKDKVRSLSGDTNVGPEIDTFIDLAEAFFNRELRTTEMETRSQADLTGEYLALPADYLHLVRIELTDKRNRKLRYVSPQNFKNVPTSVVTPQYFTIEDGQFRFRPAGTVAEPVSIEIIYLAKIPGLSTGNTSNWLLTSHPDLYLDQVLAQASKYIAGFPINVDEGLIRVRVQQINSRARQERHSGAPLVIRSGVDQCL